MDFKGRLVLKGVPFLGLRYILRVGDLMSCKVQKMVGQLKKDSVSTADNYVKGVQWKVYERVTFPVKNGI